MVPRDLSAAAIVTMAALFSGLARATHTSGT